MADYAPLVYASGVIQQIQAGNFIANTWVNWAIPGAIGATTPNTGKFTAVTIQNTTGEIDSSDGTGSLLLWGGPKSAGTGASLRLYGGSSGLSGIFYLNTGGVNFLSGEPSGALTWSGHLAVGNTPSSSTSIITAASTTGKSAARFPHGSAPTSPVNGDVWTTSAGMYAQINGATVGPFGAGGGVGGNLAINGSFLINQDAPATSADDTYAHDQWIALTQTSTIAVSSLSDVENGMPAMARLTQSQATAQRMGYLQIFESSISKALRGKTITFKIGRKRLSATDNVRIAILEWTGTADAPTSDVVNSWTSTNYTAGNFFLGANLIVTNVTQQALTANTLTDGTAVTVTLGSSVNNLMVFVWTENAVAQNVTLDLGKAKLEVGSSATEFLWPQGNDELLRCFRFYQLHLDRTVYLACRLYGYSTAGGYVVWNGLLAVPMRVPPTGTVVGTWTTTNCGQPGFGITNYRGIEMYTQVTATGTCDCYATTGVGLKLDARL